MSIKRFFSRFFSARSDQQSQKKEERRYDNVQITNAVDGTIIKGHDAVKAHFEREKKMIEEHGSSIIFQLYRINLQAETIDELQSEKIAEIKVDSGFISGDDTVAMVKEKLRTLLMKKDWANEETQFKLAMDAADRITLSFSGRPMQDKAAFYADNFVMLPAWVQVLLHRCEFEEFVELITKLRSNSQERPTR